MTTPLLAMRDVHASYGAVRALRGLTIAVQPASTVALLGANGAGKSTALRAITGLLEMNDGRVTSGDIELDGASLLGRSPLDTVRLGVSQVMEGRRVFSELTVEENLRAGGFVVKDRVARDRNRERALTLFPRLAARLKLQAGYLSGGEQQMLAIGRALMQSPRVVLLDEPTLGLAPMIVDQIMTIIGEINAAGTAVVLIEQNAAAALSVADEAYVIEQGRVVRHGRATEMADDDIVREAYLGIGTEGAHSYRHVVEAVRAGAAS
jgi:branched-chain amino acid transport system ATP-binding protein